MNNLSLKSPTDKEKINRNCVMILGALYFIALVWVIVFKCNVNQKLCIDFNRARTIWERLVYALTGKPFGNLIYDIKRGDPTEPLSLIFNIIGFIPLGLVYRFFFKKSHAYLSSFATALGIELFQLISGYGGLKIEDLVEYMVGAIVGIVLFERGIPKVSPEIINNIARVLIYIAIPCDLFFVINTIIHFPG